jgi:hypothetical protein
MNLQHATVYIFMDRVRLTDQLSSHHSHHSMDPLLTMIMNLSAVQRHMKPGGPNGSRFLTSYRAEVVQFSKECHVHAEFHDIYQFVSSESCNKGRWPDEETEAASTVTKLTKARLVKKSLTFDGSRIYCDATTCTRASHSCPHPDTSSLHDRIPCLLFPF